MGIGIEDMGGGGYSEPRAMNTVDLGGEGYSDETYTIPHRRRSSEDGMVALSRGVATLISADVGLVVEMQSEGVFNGFEPSPDDIDQVYRSALESGEIVHASDILLTLTDRTVAHYKSLLNEGFLSRFDDMRLDGLKFGIRTMASVLHTSNEKVGRSNG